MADQLPILLNAASVQDVLARYEAGEQIRDICHSYGASNVTVYKRIIGHAEEEWKALQVARALAKKEQFEEAIETAQDALSLARARDRLKAAQWDLERVCRRIYGTDSPPSQGQGMMSINISVGLAPTQTPERDVTPITVSQQDTCTDPNQ